MILVVLEARLGNLHHTSAAAIKMVVVSRELEAVATGLADLLGGRIVARYHRNNIQKLELAFLLLFLNPRHCYRTSN